MIKILTFTVLTLCAAGCVSQSEIEDSMGTVMNVQSSGSSKFDGTKFIRVSNMVCSNTVIFELYQDTSKAKDGIVLLDAGSKSIENIGNGESLHIKIDGKKYSFKSNNALTEHDRVSYGGYGASSAFSHKTYVVPEKLVRDIATSNTFLVKMNLLNNSYIEGKCSELTLQEAQDESKDYDVQIKQWHVDSSNKLSAINGFRDFVKMMDSTKW